MALFMFSVLDYLLSYYFIVVLAIVHIVCQIPPGRPVITITPSVVSVGALATVTCRSSGGDPIPTVKLSRNSVLLDDTATTHYSGAGTTVNEYTFTVLDVDHYSVFECSVANGVLQDPLTSTDYFFVTTTPLAPILNGPTFVTAGTGPHNWICISRNGYPAPTMTMRIENTQFASEFTASSAIEPTSKKYIVTGTLVWTPAPEDNGRTLYCEVRHSTLTTLQRIDMPLIVRVVIPTTETTQRPTTSRCPAARLDLVFILDSSTSVGQDNYNKMLKFCKDVIQNADIDSGIVQIGIVSYSTAVNVEFYLNSYATKTQILNAIDMIRFRNGSRNIADGLRKTRTELYMPTNGARNMVRNVAIILTTGASDINSERTMPEAEHARAGRIHIYAVGVGLQDTMELDAIASPPKELNSFNMQDFDELTVLSKCTSNHDDFP